MRRGIIRARGSGKSKGQTGEKERASKSFNEQEANNATKKHYIRRPRQIQLFSHAGRHSCTLIVEGFLLGSCFFAFSPSLLFSVSTSSPILYAVFVKREGTSQLAKGRTGGETQEKNETSEREME